MLRQALPQVFWGELSCPATPAGTWLELSVLLMFQKHLLISMSESDHEFPGSVFPSWLQVLNIVWEL